VSLFSDVQKKIGGGFGQSISSAIPSVARQAISTGTSVFQDIQDGNLIGAGQRLLNARGGGRFGNNHFNTPTAMLGGLSPAEALNRYRQHAGIDFAYKNLWLLEVSSALKGDFDIFNMYAYNVDFSPFTITGEKKQIGSAHVDLVNSGDPVEMSITTLDDVNGSIKRWFEAHAVACSASDGTVGLPNDYAIKIKVTHAFSSSETNKGGYQSKGLFRAGNITIGLSRSEIAMAEITMSFVQLDTFMGGS